MKLGDVSAYFESGNNNRSVGTISWNPSDPGGKSYGKYQIAVRTGTLKKYIAWSIFNKEFQNVHPASAEFDKIWKRLATEKQEEFEEDQFKFIKITHFDPVEKAAATLGFDTSNVGIREALFSIGVQHGGYKTILRNAQSRRRDKITVETDITNLYAARTAYVNSLSSLSTGIKKSICQRYEIESRIVGMLSLYTDCPYDTQSPDHPASASIALLSVAELIESVKRPQ